MSGRNTRLKVLRIRYKDGVGFRSRLVIGTSIPKMPGRVLRINKVGYEELFHVGEHNQLPKMLMREFKQQKRQPSVDWGQPSNSITHVSQLEPGGFDKNR